MDANTTKIAENGSDPFSDRAINYAKNIHHHPELGLTIVSMVFVVLLIIIMFYKHRRKRKGKYIKSSNVRFPYHYFRAFLILILMILTILEIGEYVVALEYGAASFLVLSSSLTVLLTIVSASIVHSIYEKRNLLMLLILQICYWIICSILKIFKIINLMAIGLNFEHARFSLTVCSTVVTMCLMVTDAVTYAKNIDMRILFNGERRSFIEKNPEVTSYKHNDANAFSQMTFWWLTELLWSGYKEPLELEDLEKLPSDKGTSICYQKFKCIYEAESVVSNKLNRPVMLWKCFLKFIYPNYCIGGVFKLFGDLVGLVGPISISLIIQYARSYANNNDSMDHLYYPTIYQFFENGYVMAIIVLVSIIAQGTLSQSSTHIINVESIRLKSALQSLLYNKCLRIALWIPEKTNSDTKNEKSPSLVSMDGGSITNLISEHTYNVISFICIGHYIWAIPLKIFALMYLLYLNLGISAIIGAVVSIFIVTPLQFLIGKAMSVNSKLCVEQSDKRIVKMEEVLQGIKILKMYAWENICKNKILEIREQELKLLNKDSVYWALITFLTHVSSALTTLVTFGLYYLLESETLTPESVFAGLALFNQLTVPLLIFPVIVPIIISAMVSTGRLAEFLQIPEVAVTDDSNRQRRNCERNGGEEENVSKFVNESSAESSKDASFTLGNIPETEEEHEAEENQIELLFDVDNSKSSSDDNVNCDIDNAFAAEMNNSVYVWSKNKENTAKLIVSGSIKIPRGKLTVIVGKIGSGKSSLLLAMTGEMNMISGGFSWSSNSTLSYTPQKPWLINSTIRDNIIFGNATRIQRYKRVLSACCLNTDLSSLPNKDHSEVGEGGSSLSGGQRQRICLARAIYSDANVLLLDDPLAALDQPVALKVFQKGIQRFCLDQNRTVIMATNDVQLLSIANQIIYVDNGNVRSVGTLSSIEDTSPDLAFKLKTLFNQNNQLPNPEKSARERWRLVKNVNNISRFKPKCDDEPDMKLETSFIPVRKRLSTFHGSRYFTHDLLLPTDECNDEIIRSSIPRRSSTKHYKSNYMNRASTRKHKLAERSSSLQAVKNKNKTAQLIRQSSSPSIQCGAQIESNPDTSRSRHSSLQKRYSIRNIFSRSSQRKIDSPDGEYQVKKQKSLIKRLSSRSVSKKKSSDNEKHEHIPVKRLISSESTTSDQYNDEDFYAENMSSITPNEEREYGNIPKKVYYEYFKSCGLFIGSLYLFSTVTWQCMKVYTDVWLSRWTGRDEDVELSNLDMKYYVRIYLILSIVSIMLSLLSNAMGQYSGALARRKLHEKLITSIIKCPIQYFQYTPLGRIMNRFSIDVGIIDKKIAISIQRLLQFLFLCLSAIIINIFVNPWFIFIAVPICVIYYVVQKFYRESARELQRLDAITKSPILSQFNETMGGVSLIRAYGQQDRFTDQLWNKIDINTNAFIILNSCNCWLGVALDYLGGLIVFVAIIASLISIRLYPETITPAIVGLAINYTLLVPIYLNWVVKFLSDMEMYMSAVERIQQYANLPVENYLENSLYMKNDWLKRGEIKFNTISLRYGDTKEPIVNNLTLFIPAGQKVAICGRTGSGKSSLLLSLLNMINICEGSVTIDDTDVKDVPLLELRSKISIVPQEVSLFSGTVRDNINPPKDCDDEKIWRKLEDINFKQTISSYPGGLDGIIRDGGSGWSAGARQLIGVMQAILKDSPLLLLDEPTATLDPQTESSLLKALLKTQYNSTVVTVAHRLSTIIDYDRVIVIDAGNIVEDGSPKELLCQTTSKFYAMFNAANN